MWIFFYLFLFCEWSYWFLGTAVAQWLRHCATNRKVAGSIPDGVIGIFHWHNPSDCKYGPGVDSASNRNEYQEDFLGVNAAGAWGWQPYHLPVPLSRNLGTLTSWNPLGHSRPVTGLIYLLPAVSNQTACNDLCRSSVQTNNNFYGRHNISDVRKSQLVARLLTANLNFGSL